MIKLCWCADGCELGFGLIGVCMPFEAIEFDLFRAVMLIFVCAYLPGYALAFLGSDGDRAAMDTCLVAIGGPTATKYDRATS
jgi:hypothetical protein